MTKKRYLLIATMIFIQEPPICCVWLVWAAQALIDGIAYILKCSLQGNCGEESSIFTAISFISSLF